MKQTKLYLTPETHLLLSRAKELTGLGRMEIALGALIMLWTKNEEPPAIAADMLEGLPDFLVAMKKPPTVDLPVPAPVKKKRKARPPGSTHRPDGVSGKTRSNP
jgi:hypothetical protein